jgi:hypothetical protein
MNISQAVRWKYPDAIILSDFIVEEVNGVQTITRWYLQTEVPTNEELESWWLEYVRSEKLKELNDKCESTICDGFISNNHEYQFDYKDQDNIGQQLTLLLLDPTINSIQWKTKDAGIVVHTRDEFIAIANDANNHKRLNMGKYWTFEAQLKTLTTESEINSIVW